MMKMERGKYLIIPFLLGLFIMTGVARAQSAGTAPPSAPTGVSVSLSKYDQISVSWSASTDDVGVAGYYLYRNGTLVANIQSTSYTDTVNPGAVYSYTVAAYDAAGNVSSLSVPSSPVSVMKDITPPSSPTWISVVPATSSVVLSWNTSTDNVALIGYYIYRNGNRIPGIANPFTATTYTDTGLSPGFTYTYKVAAYDAAGNVSYSSQVNATTISDITPPSVPSSLFVTAKSSSEIDVTWQASSDNVGVAGYYVYRNGTQVANVSSTPTTYKNTNLAAATSYLYNVVAYDAAGNFSGESYPVQGTTLPPDTSAPSAPFNLSAKPVSMSEIDLAWSLSYDNVGVVGYHVYRNGAQIAIANSPSYADTGLASLTNYNYAVDAYDAAGNVSAQALQYGIQTSPVKPQLVAATTSVTTSVTAPTVAAQAASSAPVVSSSVTSVSATPVPVISVPTASVSATFTTTLSLGLRSGDVKNLQTFLIQKGYLDSGYASGFFGTLTQRAVQQFQCDQNIVCSGSPAVTGWGMVGAKTRIALNALYGGGQSTNTASTSAAAATLQQLEAQLQALQAQLKTLQGASK